MPHLFATLCIDLSHANPIQVVLLKKSMGHGVLGVHVQNLASKMFVTSPFKIEPETKLIMAPLITAPLNSNIARKTCVLLNVQNTIWN